MVDFFMYYVGEEVVGGNWVKCLGGVGECVVGLCVEFDVSGCDVEFELFDIGCFGNGDYFWQVNQLGQCYLGGFGVDVDGDGV